MAVARILALLLSLTSQAVTCLASSALAPGLDAAYTPWPVRSIVGTSKPVSSCDINLSCPHANFKSYVMRCSNRLADGAPLTRRKRRPIWSPPWLPSPVTGDESSKKTPAASTTDDSSQPLTSTPPLSPAPDTSERPPLTISSSDPSTPCNNNQHHHSQHESNLTSRAEWSVRKGCDGWVNAPVAAAKITRAQEHRDQWGLFTLFRTTAPVPIPPTKAAPAMTRNAMTRTGRSTPFGETIDGTGDTLKRISEWPTRPRTEVHSCVLPPPHSRTHPS